jgi:hypothetical protein
MGAKARLDYVHCTQHRHGMDQSDQHQAAWTALTSTFARRGQGLDSPRLRRGSAGSQSPRPSVPCATNTPRTSAQ